MAWWTALSEWVDDNLRGFSSALQKQLRFVRLLRWILRLSLLTSFALAAAGIVWPEYLPYFLAGIVLSSSVPAIFWLVIVAIPLKASSVVRLVDKGYPANAREIAIRMAARKLHDQSIETEELLVDTAINEGRKAYNKYKARAASMAAEPDEEPEAATDKP